jgi:murein DD-endopeptidase MepM/ murein hydrolase activator NlpD
MANDGDSVIVWVKIKDSNGGCGRKEFQIRRIECPCPGDPVISPLTAETVKADGDTITIGGLYGCTRYTNTQCTRIYEGTSYNDWHGGVDISEKVGDTIYSMYEGKVIRAISPCDSLNDYCDNFNRGTCTDELGNQIKIRSSINNQTNAILYGHLKEVLVSNNQNVKADQIIGTIGKTGNACREYIIAHVHIQVKDSITQTRFDVQDLLTTKFNDDATQDSTCIN